MTDPPRYSNEDLNDLAHDLNNHINVLNGYLELLAKKLSADPEALSYIAEMRLATQRSRQLSRKLRGRE